jgi:hypothetical protein
MDHINPDIVFKLHLPAQPYRLYNTKLCNWHYIYIHNIDKDFLIKYMKNSELSLVQKFFTFPHFLAHLVLNLLHWDYLTYSCLAQKSWFLHWFLSYPQTQDPEHQWVASQIGLSFHYTYVAPQSRDLQNISKYIFMLLYLIRFLAYHVRIEKLQYPNMNCKGTIYPINPIRMLL